MMNLLYGFDCNFFDNFLRCIELPCNLAALILVSKLLYQILVSIT